MAKTRNIREDSRRAVANAGSRVPGSPVNTTGTWREERGRRVEGPFRPGKTKHERRRSS